RTLLLTTHYMAEADELCDRVAIINGGRVLACDTPARLKQRLRREPVFRLETTRLPGIGARLFTDVPGVRRVSHREEEGRARLELVLDEERVIGGVLSAMERHGVHLHTLAKH